MTVSGGWVFVADQRSGLQVVPAQCEGPSAVLVAELPTPARRTGPELVPASPNPFRDHSATWDGRDGAGSRVAGGVYFVRLRAGDDVRSGKIVLLDGR